MKTIILSFFLGVVMIPLNAQSLDWVGMVSGIGEDVVINVFSDKSKNIYTTGFFTDSTNYNQNSASLTSNGFYDIYVQKVDQDGNLMWWKNFGGAMFDVGTAVVADENENVFLTGSFQDVLKLDTDNVPDLISNGAEDIFLMKLSIDGTVEWAGSLGNDFFDETSNIAIDSEGNVYICGWFQGAVNFDILNDSNYELDSGENRASFVAKYSNDGTLIWAKKYGEMANTVPMKLRIDKEDNILVTGSFEGSIDFDPNDGEAILTSASAGGYVLKWDKNGEYLMSVLFDGGTSAQFFIPYDMRVDAAGNIYNVGYFSNTIDFDPSEEEELLTAEGFGDAFVSKLSPTGALLWAKQFRSVSDVYAFGLDLDTEGNVYTVGYFSDPTDFNPSDTEINELSYNAWNPVGTFLSVLTNDGDFIAAYEYGGVTFVRYKGIEIDENNDIYIAGSLEQSVDLDVLPFQFQHYSSAGFRDSYLLKLSNFLVTSNKDLMSDQAISIYPNPTSDYIVIEGELGNRNYQMYDVLGRRVESGKLNDDKTIVDTSTLCKGVYFLKIDNKVNFKMIKE